MRAAKGRRRTGSPAGRKPAAERLGAIRLERYPRGALIYGPQEPADRIYLLRSGRVRLLRPGKGARASVSALLGTGDLFGEVLKGRGAVMDESAVAAGDVEALSIGVRDFRALIHARPSLAVDVIQALADRLRSVRRRVQALITLDVPARLADTLLQLARSHGEACRHDGEADLRGVTHQDLADLVGASRAFVSVQMGALRRADLLAARGRTLCLRDLGGLGEAARGVLRVRS